jgi:hypothetical protein
VPLDVPFGRTQIWRHLVESFLTATRRPSLHKVDVDFIFEGLGAEQTLDQSYF